MASKNEKGAEEAAKGQAPGDGQKGGEADGDAEPSKKRKKLKLILGIAGIGLAATGVGGYFVLKTVGSKSAELSAKPADAAQPDAPAQGEPTATNGHADKGQAPEAAQGGAADKKSQDADPKASQVQDGAKGQAATQGNGAVEPNPESEGKEAAKGEGADDHFGDTVDIPSMELNLGNPLENRFLRFGLSLEYHGGEEQKKELSRRMPQIRDVVISLISRKTRVELLSADGKESFRKQLKNTLNELLQEPVTNVYFTEFLVE